MRMRARIAWTSHPKCVKHYGGARTHKKSAGHHVTRIHDDLKVARLKDTSIVDSDEVRGDAEYYLDAKKQQEEMHRRGSNSAVSIMPADKEVEQYNRQGRSDGTSYMEGRKKRIDSGTWMTQKRPEYNLNIEESRR